VKLHDGSLIQEELKNNAEMKGFIFINTFVSWTKKIIKPYKKIGNHKLRYKDEK
jgi:hypothetical protein